LDKFPELKDKMKVKTVPTIIVLNNGQEVKRTEGGLMMKISNPQSEILQ
jgi:thioredoxin-like negative regulator of GroEL